MKMHLKLFALLLCLVMLFTSLVSCVDNSTDSNSNDTKENTDSADDSQNSNIDEDKVLVLFRNGEYTASFKIPDIASDSETAVYAKLRG